MVAGERGATVPGRRKCPRPRTCPAPWTKWRSLWNSDHPSGPVSAACGHNFCRLANARDPK